MLQALNALLLLFLIVCAVVVARTRDLLSAAVIFAAYSLVMAIFWQQLKAPDLAITEAAIGAGGYHCPVAGGNQQDREA